MGTERYFLKSDWADTWTEVTREVWIRAERGAGFRPKGGGDGPATGGFSSSAGASGRIVSFKPDGTLYSDYYEKNEPEFHALLVRS